jgi:site-specific recombinase XerD
MSSDTNAQTDRQHPIEYFLEDITYQGKKPRTRTAYERVLTDFEEYLDSRGLDFDDANHRDCMAYVHRLRGTVASSTVATYASYLHRFYDYMVQVGRFDENPMSLVLEEMDESINTDPARRDISVVEMQDFFADVAHPLDRAVIGTLLKTGMRAGELCNLDLRDLKLAETPTESEHRANLDGRADAVYVDSEPSMGQAYNGEERTASNKRMRATTIPVDEELGYLLREYLAVRPDSRPVADPLFLSMSDGWGKRLTPDMVHHLVESHARDAGWYRVGGGPEENVTPHYFRHFFTTHLRDRTGDRGIVKYLRGDVAKDVIDTYTHDWGNRVRDVYEANIYRLL